MCKKSILFFLALMTSIFIISSCNKNSLSDSNMDIYEKIHNYYNQMECYSADVTFSCFSNKTENKYTAKQKAIGNDKFFVKVICLDKNLSVTTISDGKKIKTLTDGTDYSVTLPSKDTTNLLFINSFFNTYYSSEDTHLAVSSSDSGNITVLETSTFPNKVNATKLTLSIDNKTLAPISLTVYDLGGKVVISAEFSNFKYNDNSINEADFTTD